MILELTVHEWNGHLEIFSCPEVIETKFWVIFVSPNRYFTENSCWVPLIYEGRLSQTEGIGSHVHIIII